MSDILITEDELPINPLDLVEELVAANEWPFQRSGEDEIIVEITGHWCSYRLFFVWQGDFSAMQFACRLDIRVPESRRGKMFELLALVNERLWLGHFDLSGEDNTPVFRQASLLRGTASASPEQIEDLVEIALVECERFYPAFQTLIWAGKSPEEALASAIIEPVGEA